MSRGKFNFNNVILLNFLLLNGVQNNEKNRHYVVWWLVSDWEDLLWFLDHWTTYTRILEEMIRQPYFSDLYRYSSNVYAILKQCSNDTSALSPKFRQLSNYNWKMLYILTATLPRFFSDIGHFLAIFNNIQAIFYWYFNYHLVVLQRFFNSNSSFILLCFLCTISFSSAKFSFSKLLSLTLYYRVFLFPSRT